MMEHQFSCPAVNQAEAVSTISLVKLRYGCLVCGKVLVIPSGVAVWYYIASILSYSTWRTAQVTHWSMYCLLDQLIIFCVV